ICRFANRSSVTPRWPYGDRGAPTFPRSTHVWPPFVVARTSRHDRAPHGAEPSIQPRLGETQVMDCAAKPSGCVGPVPVEAPAEAGADAPDTNGMGASTEVVKHPRRDVPALLRFVQGVPGPDEAAAPMRRLCRSAQTS